MPRINLTFDLRDPEKVVVTQKSHYEKSLYKDLVLNINPKLCHLQSIKVDGKPINYTTHNQNLTISATQLATHRCFDLEVISHLKPSENTALAGLYGQAGLLSTQCEAEGFRNITPVQDRPDVLSEFTTTVLSNPGDYPVKLSNGNEIAQGQMTDGTQFSTWHDPFVKPTYLFALVAGDLAKKSSEYTTQSGRTINLNIYADAKVIDKTDYAMTSLKKAMAWDEDKFGLEYDLDTFNIVAIDDFNMGAMENKGLNIFNSKLILASPDTATDADYKNIERVVAHEYFHNWTGNRVTCRDWFQLSLKEGLTVYRDQEFSSDMNSRPVKRIHDVLALRQAQFPEDAGPMAHPIRPEKVKRFDNFYTPTVYQKGAEVVRMIENLVGKSGFRKGMDLYFKRHDGTAATCDDFVKSMEDANQMDMSQFRRWYNQAGTPNVQVVEGYAPKTKEYHLILKQSLASNAANTPRLPMVIPLNFALFDQQGKAILNKHQHIERKIILTRPEHHYKFTHLEQKPIVSLGRGFSAPVTLKMQQSSASLLTQFKHDTDLFNKFEASQKLLLNCIQDQLNNTESNTLESLCTALGSDLNDHTLEDSYKALLFNMPSLSHLKQQHPLATIDQLSTARQSVTQTIGQTLQTQFRTIAQEYLAKPVQNYQLDLHSTGERSLKNVALQYLVNNATPSQSQAQDVELVKTLFSSSTNLTDQLGSLSALLKTPQHQHALNSFERQAQDNPLVRLKFLSLVAGNDHVNTLNQVQKLWITLDKTNPNSVYALLGGFMNGAFSRFHETDGSGYQFVAQAISEVDKLNPQAAAKMLSGFQLKPLLDVNRQAHIDAALTQMKTQPLSENTLELVDKLLK